MNFGVDKTVAEQLPLGKRQIRLIHRRGFTCRLLVDGSGQPGQACFGGLSLTVMPAFIQAFIFPPFIEFLYCYLWVFVVFFLHNQFISDP